MFGLVNRGELPGVTESEFEHLSARLQHLWLVEHNEDGTHNITEMGVATDDHTHDAVDIVSGTISIDRIPTLTKVKQHAQTAYKDEANVFTADQRVNGSIGINVAPNATDGTLSLSDAIFERSRSVALGEWTTIAHAGANFTASAGTWTVDAGDQVLLRYTLVGKTLTMSWLITTSATSATPTELRIALPGGTTVGGGGASVYAGVNILNCTGVTFEVGFSQGAAGNSYVSLFRNAVAAFPNVGDIQVRGSITLEIS